MMDTSEALKDGRLDEAISSVKDAIRKAPTDGAHRSVLFQLYCLTGNWEGAQTQLKVLGDMDIESSKFVGVAEKLLECEAARREVFAGKKAPTLFGKPPEWVGSVIEAFRLGLEGNWQAAAASQATAFEAAPAIAARLNDKNVDWVADADSRLGPILEAFVNGSYYWVPLEHVRTLNFRPRTHLMDAIWAPVDFEWLNLGKAAGFIPMRYAGSETNADPQIRLGRKTEWREETENFYVGSGHRTFATSEEDVPLLEIRALEFLHPDAPIVFSTSPTPAAPGGGEPDPS